MSAFDVQTRTLISRTQLNRPVAKRIYWTVLVLAILLFAVVFLFPLFWVATSGWPDTSPPHWLHCTPGVNADTAALGT